MFAVTFINWRPNLMCCSIWTHVCLQVVPHKFMETTIEILLVAVCVSLLRSAKGCRMILTNHSPIELDRQCLKWKVLKV